MTSPPEIAWRRDTGRTWTVTIDRRTPAERQNDEWTAQALCQAMVDQVAWMAAMNASASHGTELTSGDGVLGGLLGRIL